jgi:hypothetical protein
MLGTVPMDKEIYKTYVESKRPETVDATEDESATVQDVEEKGWTGFHKDEKGFFVWNYFIKGFLKHSGNVLKDSLKLKALRSKIDDFVFIKPRKVYLNKEKADGVLERPLRAMTAQGPRVSLARSDFILAGSQFEFEILLYPPHKEITEDLIKCLLDYGELNGFGQFRNGGYGTFTYEIL